MCDKYQANIKCDKYQAHTYFPVSNLGSTCEPDACSIDIFCINVREIWKFNTLRLKKAQCRKLSLYSLFDHLFSWQYESTVIYYHYNYHHVSHNSAETNIKKKSQMPQIRIKSVQLDQNHAQLGYCWWPWWNFAYVAPGKVIWGQIMTSWGQCAFLLITFDWNEIETWGRL